MKNLNKILFFTLCMASFATYAQVKVGSNPTTIDTGTTNFQVEGTTTAEQFVILKDGKVGIGTTTPAGLLEVGSLNHTTNVTLVVTARGANGLRAQGVYRVKNSSGVDAGGAIGSDGALGGGLILSGKSGINDPHVFIETGGNVGIGTVTPTSMLSIQSASSTALSIERTGLTKLRVAMGSADTNFIKDDTTGGNIEFKTANASGTLNEDQLVLSGSTSNVGIGAATPGQKLEVNGKIKIGDDAEAPTNGTIRYNTTTNKFQGYAAGAWVDLH